MDRTLRKVHAEIWPDALKTELQTMLQRVQVLQLVSISLWINSFRFLCIEEPEKINHQEVVKKIERYRDSLPEKPGIQAIIAYYNKRVEEMRKQRTKSTYTRAQCLTMASACLRLVTNQNDILTVIDILKSWSLSSIVFSAADRGLVNNYLRWNGKSNVMLQMADSGQTENLLKWPKINW